jgi:hypothetical protein
VVLVSAVMKTSAELFAPVGIVKRAKGGRFAPRVLLGPFEGEMLPSFPGVPIDARAQVLGKFEGFNGFGARQIFEAILVTLADGRRVAAFRCSAEETKASGGGDWMVCQDHSFKLGAAK